MDRCRCARFRHSKGRGIAEIWDDIARFRAALEATGAWTQRRRDQARTALWSEIEADLLENFRASRTVAARLAALEADVIAGIRTPADAAREALAAFLREP